MHSDHQEKREGDRRLWSTVSLCLSSQKYDFTLMATEGVTMSSLVPLNVLKLSPNVHLEFLKMLLLAQLPVLIFIEEKTYKLLLGNSKNKQEQVPRGCQDFWEEDERIVWFAESDKIKAAKCYDWPLPSKSKGQIPQ